MLDQLRWATPGDQSFSAGVAVWDPATEPSAAVGAADSALYEAKRLGRDRVVAAAGTAAAGDLPAWAESVRVVLQPIVPAPDGGLVGHEASARFPHDEDVRRVLDRGRARRATATCSRPTCSAARWPSPGARPAPRCSCT